MNISLIVLIVIAGIIALLFIIGLFSRKQYSIEREIEIKRPQRDVFNYLRFIKNQDHFNKWVMVDPDMKKEFRGTDGTTGFVYAWNGNKKAGEGEQEIKRIKEAEEIDTEIRFIRPFAAKADTSIICTPLPENKTKVRWSMSSAMKYPMNIMLLFINMDKMLGKDMERSLATLKEILSGEEPAVHPLPK